MKMLMTVVITINIEAAEKREKPFDVNSDIEPIPPFSSAYSPSLISISNKTVLSKMQAGIRGHRRRKMQL